MKIKELRVRTRNGNPMLKEIYFENGGEVPETLSGMYTSEESANRAIDLYLSHREKIRPRKEKKNVESTNE